MDEREIWLKISNSCAAIAGRLSRLPRRTRNFSASVVIRRLSAASRAARPRRTNNRAAAAGTSARITQGTSVICSGCGQQTTVPFEPRGDRPVYCQNCFQSRKTSAGGGRPAQLWQGPLVHRVCGGAERQRFDFGDPADRGSPSLAGANSYGLTMSSRESEIERNSPI